MPTPWSWTPSLWNWGTTGFSCCIHWPMEPPRGSRSRLPRGPPCWSSSYVMFLRRTRDDRAGAPIPAQRRRVCSLPLCQLCWPWAHALAPAHRSAPPHVRGEAPVLSRCLSRPDGLQQRQMTSRPLLPPFICAHEMPCSFLCLQIE